MANDILVPDAKDHDGLTETTTFFWHGHWYRLETVRIGQVDSLIPDKPHAQIRDLESDEIIETIMPDYELHHAFLWRDRLYVFATDYYGIWMSCAMEFGLWSKPVMVFNSENSPYIHYQNNSIVYDGERFVMAVDLLGGPYNFTVCFAESRDLYEWHYIPGAMYKAHTYTSCPFLAYDDGYYYLFHLRHKDWKYFDIHVSRSKDLLVWEDSPNNPILTPDTAEILPPADPKDDTVYNVINVSDLNLYERDGKAQGCFHVGIQRPGPIPYVRRCSFDGSLHELYQKLYEI